MGANGLDDYSPDLIGDYAEKYGYIHEDNVQALAKALKGHGCQVNLTDIKSLKVYCESCKYDSIDGNICNKKMCRWGLHGKVTLRVPCPEYSEATKGRKI